jgi:hypothetical protein
LGLLRSTCAKLAAESVIDTKKALVHRASLEASFMRARLARQRQAKLDLRWRGVAATTPEWARVNRA